jgi:hypothetical protein
MSDAEKRELLAAWVSDARAIQNAPTLRRTDSGEIVTAEALRDALCQLDYPHPLRAEGRIQRPAKTRRKRVNWPALGRHLDIDDDDNPPPTAPASLWPANRITEQVAA